MVLAVNGRVPWALCLGNPFDNLQGPHRPALLRAEEDTGQACERIGAAADLNSSDRNWVAVHELLLSDSHGYTYIHTYTYIDKHTYIHTYIHAYIHMLVSLFTNSYILDVWGL